MPELPEVETTRRVLEPQVKGACITCVDLIDPSAAGHPAAEEFSSALIGQVILVVDRRGKFLQLRLSGGGKLIVHLRMTGSLLAVPAGHPKTPFTRVVFALDNGMEIRFGDMRRFGRLWLLQKGEEDCCTGIDRLGPEPWDVTVKYLTSAAGSSRRAIKSCLLDQRLIAGIGNIYSDEILFTARIRPDRSSDSLSHSEWQRLTAVIKERLMFFIEKNNVSAAEFLSGNGREYRNSPYFQVYGRAGTPCPVCGTELKRIVIGGRSSVFCPHCQRQKRLTGNEDKSSRGH